jgi:hypothetical protein
LYFRVARSPSAAAGARLDWDVLARRYEEQILDRYLQPLEPADDG